LIACWGRRGGLVLSLQGDPADPSRLVYPDGKIDATLLSWVDTLAAAIVVTACLCALQKYLEPSGALGLGILRGALIR